MNKENQATADKITDLIKTILLHPQKIRQVFRMIQIVVSIGLIIFSCYIGKNNFYLIWNGMRTQGTIVDFKQVHWTSRGKNGTTTNSPFMPIVEFQINDQVVRFQDSVGSNSSAGLKSQITVLYDPDDPVHAIIERPIMNWIPWGPMLTVGLFLLLIALRSPKRNVGPLR